MVSGPGSPSGNNGPKPPGPPGGARSGGSHQPVTPAPTTCVCKFPKTRVNVDGKIGDITKIMMNEFFKPDDGSPSKKCRHVCGNNPNKWQGVEETARPPTPPKAKSLWVVLQAQEEMDPHWLLFAAFDDGTDDPEGYEWHVKGDADVGMTLIYRAGVSIFTSASFAAKVLICHNTLSPEMENKLDEITKSIPPPRARTPSPDATVEERQKTRQAAGTCRTWLWEVLDKLVEEKIITKADAAEGKDARKLVKPKN